MEKDLIYDVGLHDGNDTAYYLSKGYRVVGIEADPSLVERARLRFSKEIEQGRLTLLEIGIGPKEGLTKFWVCEAVREWNSFDKVVASRLGMQNYSIDVYCRLFGDVLREHGIPYYLKIDIENYDRYCVEAIDPAHRPEYISMELGSIDDLIALRRVGYNGFKLIHQSPRFGFSQFHATKIEPIESMELRVLSPLQEARCSQIGEIENAGEILPGPSGPFGVNTDGTWDNFEQAAYDSLSFILGHSQYGKPPNWFIWFDIHATNYPEVRDVPPLYD